MALLRAAAYTGGEWVIWVLLALSVGAVAVILERGALLRREGILRTARPGGSGALGPFYRRVLARAGTRAGESGKLRDRMELERRLMVLGSLGALAPFIGLFGTILGIIRAFHDLAQIGAGHPEIVMQGIAEALIATAAGILLAVVCVASYNFFRRRIRDAFTMAEYLEASRGGSRRRN